MPRLGQQRLLDLLGEQKVRTYIQYRTVVSKRQATCSLRSSTAVEIDIQLRLQSASLNTVSSTIECNHGGVSFTVSGRASGVMPNNLIFWFREQLLSDPIIY